MMKKQKKLLIAFVCGISLVESSIAQSYDGKAMERFFENTTPKNNPASDKALEMLGSNYKWGGSSEKLGMDCSGFVYRSYKDALGLELPRTASEMALKLPHILPHELKAGDLVFFNTLGRSYSHVGIYLGGFLFAHSPKTGEEARIDRLDHPYWLSVFSGARRPKVAISLNAVRKEMNKK